MGSTHTVPAFGTYALSNTVASLEELEEANRMEYTPVATTKRPLSADWRVKLPYGLDGGGVQIGAPEGLFRVAMKYCV
jgi:hypothetical protein